MGKRIAKFRASLEVNQLNITCEIMKIMKYHQGSSSHPDNASWFPDTLSQMCRWVDNN